MGFCCRGTVGSDGKSRPETHNRTSRGVLNPAAISGLISTNGQIAVQDHNTQGKGKSVPLQDRSSSEGFQEVKVLRFHDNGWW